jgi:hypothetical protein
MWSVRFALRRPFTPLMLFDCGLKVIRVRLPGIEGEPVKAVAARPAG